KPAGGTTTKNISFLKNEVLESPQQPGARWILPKCGKSEDAQRPPTLEWLLRCNRIVADSTKTTTRSHNIGLRQPDVARRNRDRYLAHHGVVGDSNRLDQKISGVHRYDSRHAFLPAGGLCGIWAPRMYQ